MPTKTEFRILELFCRDLTGRFTIKKVAELLDRPYPLVYHSVQSLLQKKHLLKDEFGLVCLNYKEDLATLAYIEGKRAHVFLSKNKLVSLFFQDFMKKMPLQYFTFLLFGSYVKGKRQKNSDLDVLIVVDDESKISFIENLTENVAAAVSLRADCRVITPESVKEMLLRREEKNLLNETLCNHIILFGAENYYLMLKNDR